MPPPASSLRLHVHAVGAVMGGATRHLAPFLGALRAERPDWQVHVWHTAGAPVGALPAGVTTTGVPGMGVRGRLQWENVELPRALRDTRADALLCLTNSGPLRAPVPVLLYQRNALWFDPSWLERLSPRARAEAAARRALTFAQARAAATVIVPSAAMAGFLTRWPAWPERTEVRVVPHAVDTTRFPFVERPWPPPADRPVRLLSVGHAAPHKDQLLLLELVAALRDEGIDVALTLTVERADRPDYVDEIERRRAALRLEDRVELAGHVRDVERWYAWADVAVLSSISESFGFPVIEALASGLPIVASRIDATWELLGDLGWWFPVGDVQRAAEVVGSLLATDAATVTSRVATGRTTIAGFSWPANARSVAVAVESVVRSATTTG